MAIQVNKRMVEIEEYVTSDGTVFKNRHRAEAHEIQLAEKTYQVVYYFTGVYTTRVQALDEEEAKERAKKTDYPYPEDIDWELDTMEAEEI